MSVTGYRLRKMQHLSTVFLVVSLLIIINQGRAVTAGAESDIKADQIAEESKDNALMLTNGPKYVKKQSTARNNTNETRPKVEAQNHKPEQRPPSKPPINADKPHKYYVELTRTHFNPHQQKLQLNHHFPPSQLPLYHSTNSVYKFPQVIPLAPHKNGYYIKQQPRPLVFASSSIKTSIAKSPKFSLPVQTITGVRNGSVKPPQVINVTTTSTTTIGTTTTRPLRTKRIWPKRMLNKINGIQTNSAASNDTKTIDDSINETDPDTAETIRVKYIYKNTTAPETPKKRGYRPVTRAPKIRSTTQAYNVSEIKPNDWIPLIPSHYAKHTGRPTLTRINRRSDVYPTIPEPTVPGKRMLYLHSFRLIPVNKLQSTNLQPHIQAPPEISRKKTVFFRKRKRHLNPYYSGYSAKPEIETPHHYHVSQVQYEDQQTVGSQKHPRVVTKVKHHHHHHHHRYVKTVEKPVKVPYKVEVPKPYPVPVEKKVPYPVERIKVVEKPVPYQVTVEKKVPYPVGFKVPHPVPVKVIEKEYIPKPYPVVQRVPVVQQVRVPQPVRVTVEKKVPYPVEVHVPVDRPVPVPVTVEKQVPYPVPVKVLVPQPYPVETKVPYPVQVRVKEPFEVIKHVPIRVPVPQPFAVKVPHPVPVTVEKKVPYPVEVERKVPVPFKVLVPQKVEVEKKVPVYVPKPYPVEKKVPVPVKVPYPVKVPVKVPVQVPVEVPVYIQNPFTIYGDDYYASGGVVASEETVTNNPHHTVTVHGNTGFTGFKSRSDTSDTTEAATTPSTPSP